MDRMDRALIDAHNSLHALKLAPSWENFDNCIDCMWHALVILKWAYHKNGRIETEKVLNKLMARRDEMKSGLTSGASIDISEEIKQLMQVLDNIYRCKQEVGLGIPKAKFYSARAKITQAMDL